MRLAAEIPAKMDQKVQQMYLAAPPTCKIYCQSTLHVLLGLTALVEGIKLPLALLAVVP